MSRQAKSERVIINIAPGADSEPTEIFVSVNDEPCKIRRGVDVAVKREVLSALDDAITMVPEKVEGDDNRVNWVPRKRFPYSLVGAVA